MNKKGTQFLITYNHKKLNSSDQYNKNTEINRFLLTSFNKYGALNLLRDSAL